MCTPQTLREELVAIQNALVTDALEHLPQMVQTYHTHLHAFMAAGIEGAREPLRQLQDMHQRTIAQLQQRQQRLHVQMRANHHNQRATRAYLSSPP